LSKLDLTKLTKAQKLEMLDALEEKKRRQLEQRANFIPNAGQAPVIETFCDEKIETILVLSGNGMGKSALGANLAIESALGYIRHTKFHMPVPARIVVVLDKPEKVDSVWLPEIKKWYPLKAEQCHKKGKPYISQLTFDNGSELLWMFHDQDPMSFESIEGDVFIFDEPPPEHVFIALRRAGRKKGRKPKYVIIGTPIAAPWLRKKLYEPWARGDRPEVMCFRFSTEVNAANLSDNYVEDFSRYLSDKEQRIRLHGEFFDLEGLALAHLFDRSKHVVARRPWPSGFPVVIAIDPHPRKKHHAIMVGVTPNNDLVVVKELSSKSAPSDFALELKSWYAGFRVVDIVCDSFGSADLTGGEGRLSFIQVLKDRGIRVRATTYNEKQDEAFIQMIQEVLLLPSEPDNYGRERPPRLTIFDGNPGIVADIESVEWQKYRNIDEFKPKLGIESKDFLSCLKYALATQPRFDKRLGTRIHRPEAPVSWSQKARGRLKAAR
jgi:hypothetical protein